MSGIHILKMLTTHHFTKRLHELPLFAKLALLILAFQAVVVVGMESGLFYLYAHVYEQQGLEIVQVKVR